MRIIHTEHFEHLRQHNPALHDTECWELTERHFDTDLEVSLHYHESLEVNICEQVSGSIRIENREYDLLENPIIVLAPKRLHSYRIRGDGGRMRVCHISVEGLKRLLQFETILTELSLDLATLPAIDESYNGIIESISELFAASDTIDRLSATLQLFRALSQVRSERLIDRPDELLSRVIAYTETHYPERITLEELSSHLGLSRSYFCRSFKSRTGIPYWDYLTAVRIEHARRLLEAGAYTAEAGEACGFYEPSYFIRIFKNHIGKTPGEYRKGG